MANKPQIYYSKFPSWPPNLIFGTSGSLEQLENFMKKHYKETLIAFGSVLKVFLQLLGWQSYVAPFNG